MLEDKVENNTQSEQQNEKRLKKNEDCLEALGQHEMCLHHRNTRNRRREQGIENMFEEIMTENFPSLVKEKVMQIQSTESPNQDELKEAHSKTHHN